MIASFPRVVLVATLIAPGLASASTLTESEPNDTEATADELVSTDTLILADIDASDEDVFEIEIDSGDSVVFSQDVSVTHLELLNEPAGCDISMDDEIWLWDSLPVSLEAAREIGSGISYVTVANGTTSVSTASPYTDLVPCGVNEKTQTIIEATYRFTEHTIAHSVTVSNVTNRDSDYMIYAVEDLSSAPAGSDGDAPSSSSYELEITP